MVTFVISVSIFQDEGFVGITFSFTNATWPWRIINHHDTIFICKIMMHVELSICVTLCVIGMECIG